jgi:hypothetical protein
MFQSLRKWLCISNAQLPVGLTAAAGADSSLSMSAAEEVRAGL